MAQGVAEEHLAEFARRFEKDIVIRPIAEVDPAVMRRFVRELYADEFNAARYADDGRTARLWEWKYRDNPAMGGTDRHGWVASHNGELIGQFHFIPAVVKAGAREYPCAWGSDLAIRRQYRSLGVSALLIRRAHEELARDRALILLGGMNPNSYAIFKNSGFIDCGRMPRYVRTLPAFSMAGGNGVAGLVAGTAARALAVASGIAASRAGLPEGMRVAEVKRFDGAFDDLWERASARIPCIARRDARFLNWRFIDQPLWPYTALKAEKGGVAYGYAVLRDGEVKNGRMKGARIGVISDILIDPDTAAAGMGLVREVVRIFRERGACLVKCDIVHGPTERILARSGFLRMRGANAFMLGVYDAHIAGPDGRCAEDRANWFVSAGDSDLDFD